MDQGYQILDNLCKVPRFTTVSMFMTSKEKKGWSLIHRSLLVKLIAGVESENIFKTLTLLLVPTNLFYFKQLIIMKMH